MTSPLRTSIEIVKKSTPKQIMKYQIALSLHRLLNSMDEELSLDQVMVMDQAICTSRQLRFQVQRKFNQKVGMNIPINKFYYINDEIGFDMLNLSDVHYKRLCKFQYLKYGNTYYMGGWFGRPED